MCVSRVTSAAKGLEVRRENPFPSSSERGALEASAAAQKALVAGKRGLIIDIEVGNQVNTSTHQHTPCPSVSCIARCS